MFHLFTLWQFNFKLQMDLLLRASVTVAIAMGSIAPTYLLEPTHLVMYGPM